MKKKLMLAMSGGVDSSAALALLTKNYEVIGGTLQLFDKEADTGSCGNPKDIEDARAVADKFGVPHHVFTMKQLFREKVIGDFIGTYLCGGTPNPCIQCNKHLKFGALLDEAVKLGCDCFATGHYARVEYDEATGRYLLKKATCGGDINPKDQSYVLYNLTQAQLSRIVFPLGTLTKAEVREIAEAEGLVNAGKADSQDICFVPDGDYAAFIGRNVDKLPPEGDFTDCDGNIVGRHKGIIHYTIGQRKGLGIAFGTPMYVVGKNADTNTVILGESGKLFTSSLIVRDVNFISIEALTSPLSCKAKTRYSQNEQDCVISPLPDGRVKVEFSQPQRAVTRGQSAVFYDGDVVIGGGIIE